MDTYHAKLGPVDYRSVILFEPHELTRRKEEYLRNIEPIVKQQVRLQNIGFRGYLVNPDGKTEAVYDERINEPMQKLEEIKMQYFKSVFGELPEDLGR